MSATEWAALAPVAIVAIGFEIFCMIDLFRSADVRYLPRWLWAIICIISIPIGGIAYLIFGKTR